MVPRLDGRYRDHQHAAQTPVKRRGWHARSVADAGDGQEKHVET